MKNIILLTGSQRKKKSFEKVLSKYNIKVDINDIWIPEIQAEDNADVAKFSAEFGANLLSKPVVKMDSGFFIEGLGGFPGPLVSYVDKGIGADLFFEILKKIKNKNARINNTLAYCEPNTEPIVFKSGCTGRIVEKIKLEEGSFIDRLFIPLHRSNKEKLTLGEIRYKNYDQFLEIWGDAEEKFAKWYVKK